MADSGIFNWRQWKRGQPRLRGRGRGFARGYRWSRGRGRGRGQNLQNEKWASLHVVGRTDQNRGEKPPIPAVKQSVLMQPDEGRSDHHHLPDDALSPSSSSSSKRSCAEIEDVSEDSGTALKRRCRKILSGSFPSSRDGDGIARDKPVQDLAQPNLQGHSDSVVCSENWDEVINDTEQSTNARAVSSLKQVQDSYQSCESTEEDQNDSARREQSKVLQPQQQEDNKLVKDNVDVIQQRQRDAGVEHLSNAITENCICTSGEDGMRLASERKTLLSVPGQELSSFSSPTAGSRQRPGMPIKSKSDSWISKVDCSKRREKFKRRQRSAVLKLVMSSSDEDGEVNVKAVSTKGSSQTKLGQTVGTTAASDGNANDGNDLASPGQMTSISREPNWESEEFDGDVDSSPSRDVQSVDDSPTDDERWDSIVQKLSAGGVDTEDVPSIQTKLNEFNKKSTAGKKAVPTSTLGPPPYIPVIPRERYQWQDPMDAPLQFRPGFHAMYPPLHTFPYPKQYMTPPGQHFPTPQHPYMWSMRDPYSFYGHPPGMRHQEYLPPFPGTSPPPHLRQPNVSSRFQRFTGTSTDAIDTMEPQSMFPMSKSLCPSLDDTSDCRMHEDGQGLDEENWVERENSYQGENWSGDFHVDRYKDLDRYEGLDTGTAADYTMENPDSSIAASYSSEEAKGSYQNHDQQIIPDDRTEAMCRPESDLALHGAFIPRQVAINSFRQRGSDQKEDQSGMLHETLHLDNPDWQPANDPSSSLSTKDSQIQYLGETEGAEVPQVTSFAPEQDSVRDQPQQNWYDAMNVASEEFGPIRRKSKVWGQGVKPLKHQVPNLEEQPTSRISSLRSSKGPLSYAAVVSSKQRADAMSISENVGKSTPTLNLSATKSFWQCDTPSFEYTSPADVTFDRNQNTEMSRPMQVTTPQMSGPHRFRSWSAGAQGWTKSSDMHVFHPDSAPPKAKTFAEVLQRPRRLTLEDEVRAEMTPKLPSWRSSLESDDILEVQYPFSDVDYIDSHCHIDLLYQRYNYKGTFSKFTSTNKFPTNFAGCVAIFCYPVNFSSGYNLANDLLREPNVWGSFGCHPHQVKHYDGVMEQRIMDYMNHPKTVALGEIGLDYSNRPIEMTSDHELQKVIFRRQLSLALEAKKPLVIHCRDAEEDTLSIMMEMVPRNHKIHRHCFTGPPQDALTFLKAFPNSFIGLTALVTFPTATNTHQTARAIPLNRLLLETDTPYFVPKKVRGMKWSHPGMAILVAERIAQLRGIQLDKVLAAVRENTKLMYGI
ncbi:uncharacterized protein [Diadema antillarum]|uniref:uncharacterized protein n=1 Tax=Diadema antillarum TaxID=105358 RepID=UPI003A898D92